MSPRAKTRLRVLRGHDLPPEARGDAALITLVRVVGRMTELMSALAKRQGITLPHFEVLASLMSGEGISQQELSERLLMTKGNICMIVQKMELSGLIDRRPDPTDQRFHRLYLTDAGRRMLAKFRPEIQTLNSRVLRGLTAGDQKTLYEMLSRIDQAIDDMGDE